MKEIITILLLAVIFLSCGEGDIEDSQDDAKHNGDNGKLSYSGITETDEEGNFISIDMDDWRDDSILEGCYAYPNPTGYYVKIRYKLLSDAYVLLLVRDSKGERIRKCVIKGITDAVGGLVVGDRVNVDGTVIFCDSDWQSGWRKVGQYYTFWDLRILVSAEKVDGGFVRPLYERVPPGIYRVFIYATDSEVIYKMLKDTGVTNAPKEKYSMVYGDIKFEPGPPAKIERTDPPNGGTMKINGILKIFFDAPVRQVTVNDDGASNVPKSWKSWEWRPLGGLLSQGIQTLKIRWINFNDTEGSHSITVTVK